MCGFPRDVVQLSFEPRAYPGERWREVTMDALAYNIAEACAAALTSRTVLYESIRSGALRAVKRGSRTLILKEDLSRWVANLPAIQRAG